MDSYNTGSIYHTTYSHYDGNLDGTGVKGGNGECYAFVKIMYGTVEPRPGDCVYTPNADSTTVWVDTAIVALSGTISRFSGVTLAGHEEPDGICNTAKVSYANAICTRDPSPTVLSAYQLS